MKEAWVLRRNGRSILGLVITVEPSLLERMGVPSLRDADGHVWYEVWRRS